MSRIAVVFGGAGFVGRYVVRRLAQDGWRVRVAVRRPKDSLFVRTYGVVGQVEPVFCDLRDESSIALVLEEADAAVNSTGILAGRGDNSFEAVHVAGPERIARLCAEKGVGRLVHVSALGASKEGPSEYARSKWQGEQAVLRHRPDAMILRPSVIFGPEDEFFNRFARMALLSPVIPIVGARTRFQPVYVDDVAAAAMKGVDGLAGPGIHELAGPDVETFRALIDRLLQIIERRRIVLPLPFWAGGVMAAALSTVDVVTGGLVPNTSLTLDMLRQLRVDNVASGRHPGLADLGIDPTPMDAILPGYLWPWRPGGQYAEQRRALRRVRRA